MAKKISTKVNYQVTELVNNLNEASTTLSEQKRDFFTTKALGEGIGLGLYVSKKIVHEHGGIIYFESKKGATDFTVALPFK